MLNTYNGGDCDMDNENSKTLTAEQEMQLRKPIEDYVVRFRKRLTVSERMAQIR